MPPARRKPARGSRTERSAPSTSRPARKRQELRESTMAVYRDAIITAAERVFVRSGFAKVKMADIAMEAGLAAGTLYNYFDSKERIFRTLIEQRGDDFLLQLEAAGQGDNARERLGTLIATVLGYIETYRSTFALFVELGGMAEWSIRRVGGPRSERLYLRYLQIAETIIQDGVHEGLLSDDTPVRDQVACLTGMINGVVREWLSEEKGALRDRVPLILSVYLRGLERRS